jgi:predicted ATPase
MIHLRSVTRGPMPNATYPFSVPAIRSLTEIAFTSEITFFVGENGSGKSTLLEAIAFAAGSHAVGSESVDSDRTLIPIRALAKILKLVWAKKNHRGFFLRAEDFFGFTKRVQQMRDDLRDDLAQADHDYKDRSDYAKALAQMPYRRELHELRQKYGDDMNAQSHGESFFALFKSRFVPDGLYLLDEPEAALSPMRQLIFLSMLRMMVGQRAQFIIATHSPILLAFPGATILNFDKGVITPTAFDALDHVVITRAFLNDPASYLDRLFADLDTTNP